MKKIIDKFETHNFHDFNIEAINIEPSNNYNKKNATVAVTISDPDSKIFDLIFQDCTNISFSADFDLLKDNSGAGQTSHALAKDDENYLTKAIRNIERFSNIEYEGMESPVDQKLQNITSYTGFEMYFFGGTLVVVAKDFIYTAK